MSGPQVVASRYAPAAPARRQLWKAAIKWPMYSVAVMPVLLAAGWQLGQGQPLRWGQLLAFLLAAVLLLAWENLANDVFDADTGVDRLGKPHSVVNLTGRRDRVAVLAHGCLVLGLLLIALVAARSSPAVLALVLACCGVGYAYQGPPLRLGYLGLGEPLCWLAFGPLATAAALLALAPAGGPAGLIPWRQALLLGSGPAVATSLVLFCSHFHQVEEDAAHGKRSPVVRLGTGGGAALVPWFVALTLALQWAPVLLGRWPLTALLGVVGLPAGRSLIQLLREHHADPERIGGSKFLALKFQAFNGLGLACGLAVGPWLGRWLGRW
ncbi:MULTISPECIES: 2-carboxy-1,4-naphthoquinone phytyltransferase [unclassified Synechococcus]|uniref:2-carboxy-1,4-naphthoquinone phytyltransferase n=1 Tax=unclassified Synechococcus TaxID=2626047 RepID=UPI0021A5C790|nr:MULTISPECIES: 2-carboxy-1,4-naphthoquinone phytyltransferase [unclassified Synechococcus]MCT0214172.1 2-carboxy-1,4-naphthoquinone phytyltransferase [Synechococcus sp. CS-1326]MCT0232502.1 2-carboxy-1,4-naphthoquinone phytyltransferase [Synechococcus sp. CS-1327]